MHSMRMEISSESGSVTRDLQVYAEYRVFSAIGPLAARIESIAVHVRDNAAIAPGTGATCAITVQLSAAGRVRTQCTGPHPAAAIDRAAERVVRAISTKLSNRPLHPRPVPPVVRRGQKKSGSSA